MINAINVNKNNSNFNSNNNSILAKNGNNIIDNNTSETKLNYPPTKSEEITYGIDWPYDENDLYKIALNFFKDNEGKAFQPSYDQRNTLIAYSLQEKHGQFNPEKAIPLGTLDFVGHDRRNAWISLNDMSKKDASNNFVQLLNQLCPVFRSYLIAVKFDIEEKERKRKELKEKEHQELEILKKQKEEQEEKNKIEEKQRQYEKQKRFIQEFLNRQTINQFSNYAKQQYPNSLELQEQLIKQLQEQHYQQYIQQMMELQQTNGEPLSLDSLSYKMNDGDKLAENIEQLSLNNNNDFKNENNKNSNFTTNNNRNIEDLATSNDYDEEVDEESEESCYTKNINNAQMWTRKDLVAFKESVQAEGGDGIIKIGHGKIATIRIPTHDDGSCLYWEFATDYYDIGFGLFFEWNSSPDNQMSIYVNESEEDEEEEEPTDISTTAHDIEKGTRRILNAKSSHDDNHSAISAIIPIYRRDSHEEVFSGRHMYPGQGVYLLKFDNSYSLWRSKTLYYRIYYTKEP